LGSAEPEERSSSGPTRLDKWLWFARVVRTRSDARDLAVSGHVRINGKRAEQAAASVRQGDVLTIALSGGVRVLRVLDLGVRRGAAPAARTLYEQITPPPVTTRP